MVTAVVMEVGGDVRAREDEGVVLDTQVSEHWDQYNEFSLEGVVSGVVVCGGVVIGFGPAFGDPDPHPKPQTQHMGGKAPRV